ncbi:Penicillin-binding protein 1A, partial [Haemophilus influenzae]
KPLFVKPVKRCLR